ncbi:hypothetical protein [Polyangium spumosum]|uniref:Uncharacterized protein n=1 Tax=Polyangium spumosum TaxID=889282 RepID=A0A6N7Q636_9BACT|nr:hypothetical protein [Polyangium spumosum]MRG98145.1 hypothetical protein [Polyangium spumosum]
MIIRSSLAIILLIATCERPARAESPLRTRKPEPLASGSDSAPKGEQKPPEKMRHDELHIGIGPLGTAFGALPFPVNVGGMMRINAVWEEGYALGLNLLAFGSPTSRVLYNAPVYGYDVTIGVNGCIIRGLFGFCTSANFGLIETWGAEQRIPGPLTNGAIGTKLHGVFTAGPGLELRVAKSLHIRPFAELGLMLPPTRVIVDGREDQQWRPFPIFGIYGVTASIVIPMVGSKETK